MPMGLLFGFFPSEEKRTWALFPAPLAILIRPDRGDPTGRNISERNTNDQIIGVFRKMDHK